MREPSFRTSRLVIAGAFCTAIVVGVASFVAGRATSPTPVPAVERPPAPVVTEAAQPGRLARADIIALTGLAADAAASGRGLPAEVTRLAGRRFEFAIPFGCAGPAEADSSAPLRWRYDEATQTLRIHVGSLPWSLTDWGLPETPNGRQSGEGFWISRPWSTDKICPPAVVPAGDGDMQPAALPERTLAIAQFRVAEDEGEAEQEVGRSFDTVKRIGKDEFDPSRGFVIRLTGRIGRLPDGQPVRCIQPAGSEQRPICVIAASFDELRIESAASPGVIAAWQIGHAARGD